MPIVRYFHPVRGNDANDGTTEATAWANIGNTGQVYGAPDVVYRLAAGQTHTLANGQTFASGTEFDPNVAGSGPLVLEAYQDSRDTPTTPYATLTCPSNPSFGIMLNCSQAQWQEYRWIDFVAPVGTTYGAVVAFAQGTTNHTEHLRYINCKFRNPYGMGLTAAFDAASTTRLNNIQAIDCEFLQCAWHGAYLQGTNHKVIRPKAIGNGGNSAPGGGHGISTQGLTGVYPAGQWTLVSGTIYTRNLTTVEADAAWAAPYYVWVTGINDSIFGYPYVRNDAAGTSPAPGEVSRVGSAIYINPGVDLTGGTVNINTRPATGIVVCDGEASGNIDVQANHWVEGHGVAFDRPSFGNTVRRMRLFNNRGYGVSINGGFDNVVEDNIVTGSWHGTVNVVQARRTKVHGNTGFDNHKGTLTGNSNLMDGHAPDGVEFRMLDEGGEFINNVGKAGNAAVQFLSCPATGLTIDSNTGNGYGTAPSATGTNYTTADPLLQTDGTPRAGSPVLATGKRTSSRLDVHGRTRGIRPSRGAVEPRRNVPVLPAPPITTWAGLFTALGSPAGAAWDFTDATKLRASRTTGAFGVTASDPIGYALDVSRGATDAAGPGVHLNATSDARRPVWGSFDGGAINAGQFNGTEHAMRSVGALDLSAYDEVHAFAAVRALANGTGQMVVESGPFLANGSFYLFRTAANEWQPASRGTIGAFPSSSAYSQPEAALLYMRAKISTPSLTLSRNGSQIISNSASQGAGNYTAEFINVGARNGGASLCFTGRIARLAIIAGPMTSEQIATAQALIGAGLTFSP